MHVITHVICIVGQLLLRATNFVDFVDFSDFHKLVSPKLIGNPIVTWIADWREMQIRENCFLEISFLAKFVALEKRYPTVCIETKFVDQMATIVSWSVWCLPM